MKKYPEEVIILLADSVRPEIGGTTTLVGIYTGDNIVIEKDAVKNISESAPLLLPRITFWALFRCGEGEFSISFELSAPSGKQLGSGKIENITQAPGQTINFTMPISPFPVPELGNYCLKLKLDNEEHKFNFDVLAQ
ncbi:MAG: hypothetical protein ABW072_06205 [Sedimenticola sp.]